MEKIKLTRWAKGPLLEPIDKESHWWEAGSVFNPAAVIKGGKIYLLYRARSWLHFSNFGLAILKDPFTVEERYPFPVLEAGEANPFERFGVEDPRIVFMEGRYWIVYTAVSTYPRREREFGKCQPGFPWRMRCSLASTRDFIYYQHHGIILPDFDTKDGTLFPEKIGGKYALIHRIFPDMWISFSDKINHFPKGEVLCRPRKNSWDNKNLGIGAPPIKTPIGWLCFYHGVHETKRGIKYMVGILILDLKNPCRILYRSPSPVLEPEAGYEKKGYVDEVVFPCGAIEWRGKYYVYYGAADKCVNVAYVDKKELLTAIDKKIR